MDKRGPSGWRQPPIVWLTLGLLLGQGLGGRVEGAAWAAALLAAGATCLIRRRVFPPAVGVVLLVAAFGFLQMQRVLHPSFSDRHVASLAGSTALVRARIAERPRRGMERTRLVVTVESVFGKAGWQPAVGRVQVTVWRCEQPWRRGDRLEARLSLRRPRNFGNPGEFDYEAYLARRGIYVTGFARSDGAWERRAPPWAPGAGLERWRDRIAAIIDGTLQGAEREILSALIIGGTELRAETRQRYARAGVSHVLAISGLHVGLVAGAALALWRWLLSRKEWLLLRANVPKLAVGLTLLPVVLYAGLAGATVPTLRAVITGLLVAGALLVDRRHYWLATLAAAALAISLIWPGSLFEISFQLSFAAVLAIVLGMRRLLDWWWNWEEAHLVRLRAGPWWLLRWLVMYVGVSLCASAGTLPLSARHFNLVSCVGPLANPVLVPVLGFLPVSLGLLAAVAAPLSTGLGAALVSAAGAVIRVGDRLVAAAAALPGAAVRVVTPTWFELAVVYVVLGASLLPVPSRRRVLAVCVLLLCVDAGWWYACRFHRSALRITFLSVGHGDCAIVEFPGSQVLVVDGGGLSSTFDVGERLVARHLWNAKIGRLEWLALTHADFDHYGGLGFLAREFDPQELWWNGSPGEGPRVEAFWKTIHEQGVPRVLVQQGFRRSIGGVELLALAPDPSAGGNDNDRSMTLRLRYGPTVVLLPGDTEQNGERRLVAALRPLLRSRILKVPHHGSASSNSAPFLDAVAPRLAVASVGHGRRFGLPHASVLGAYDDREIRLLRTDRDGAVIVDIDAHGTVTVTRGREGHGAEAQMPFLPLDTRMHRSLIPQAARFTSPAGIGRYRTWAAAVRRGEA